MKKTLLVFTLLLTSFYGFSQEEEIKSFDNYEKPNEVKINALMLLIGAFEGIYERNLNEESSVGISLFIPYDKDNFGDNINYYISPYYRIFFGKKYAAGFFVEGFGMLNSTHQSYASFDNFIDSTFVEIEEDKLDFALGLGIGGKWVTKRGYTFEINSGFGRNLFNSINDDYDFVGKFGFNLGYRF